MTDLHILLDPFKFLKVPQKDAVNLSESSSGNYICPFICPPSILTLFYSSFLFSAMLCSALCKEVSKCSKATKTAIRLFSISCLGQVEEAKKLNFK